MPPWRATLLAANYLPWSLALPCAFACLLRLTTLYLEGGFEATGSEFRAAVDAGADFQVVAAFLGVGGDEEDELAGLVLL